MLKVIKCMKQDAIEIREAQLQAKQRSELDNELREHFDVLGEDIRVGIRDIKGTMSQMG